MGPLIEGTLEGAERVSDIVQDLRRYSGGQQEQNSRFELASLVRKAVDRVVKAGRIKPEISDRLPVGLKLNREGQGAPDAGEPDSECDRCDAGQEVPQLSVAC